MNVMKRAWAIAKKGAKKFGGNVKEYFAESLKIAWEEVKNPYKFIAEKVKDVNNNLYFVVADSENMKVNVVIPSKSLKTEKTYYNFEKLNPVAKGKYKGTPSSIFSVDTWNSIVDITTNGVTKMYKITRGKFEELENRFASL